MKKYDEFELDLKNEEVQKVDQPMEYSIIDVATTIYHITKYSVQHGCSNAACTINNRTVNGCRTM
ncbi:hypothetical protein [Paraclostridium sordellii]|uniref:hypothetical protein n=1 Tax=Paraclostridium sordellii TaxID=1505 RepID=UPI001F0690A0|nr:hypothetical protein [Paeniclostridium sordellii]MCH1965361.1 hypothetical protein [Paeniclostridium sordellii]